MLRKLFFISFNSGCSLLPPRADHALLLQKGLMMPQGTADELANSPALPGYLGV